jgi:hypothetical protein
MTANQDPAEMMARFQVGTRVTSDRRGNAVGIVRTAPFCDETGQDRRWWVWVDYTASNGAVALDQVRHLQVVTDS